MQLMSVLQSNIYFHVSKWLTTGFGFIIGFIDHLQAVTTNNYNTIANFHTSKHFTRLFSVYLHINSSNHMLNLDMLTSCTRLYSSSLLLVRMLLLQRILSLLLIQPRNGHGPTVNISRDRYPASLLRVGWIYRKQFSLLLRVGPCL
jgi:hypothetical protein